MAAAVASPMSPNTLSLTFHSAALFRVSCMTCISCISWKRCLLVSKASRNYPQHRITIARLPYVGSDHVSKPLLEFNIEETDYNNNPDLTIVCEIKEGLFKPHKTVATTMIPVKTFLAAGDGVGDKIEYPLFSSSAKIKGEIILSHELAGVVRDNVSRPVIAVDDEAGVLVSPSSSATVVHDGNAGTQDKPMKVLQASAYTVSIVDDLSDLFSNI